MKIFGKNISFRRRKEKLASKNVVTQYPTTVSTTQPFSTYKSIQGTQQLSFELIDDLYNRTVMNRIINKIAGDASRMAYTVRYTGMDNKFDEELELLGLQIDILFTRSVLRNIVRDQLKYGTAFLFVKYESGVPTKMYTVHPKYITPVITDGELTAWEFNESGTIITLTTKELICFPYDPSTGEIFGNSILSPLIQTLELFLNVQLDLSILVDRFAIPILKWSLDNGLEGVKETDEEILAFMKSLAEQLSLGSDVGTGSGVTVDVIGTDSTLIDFIPILKDLKESIGIISNVPLQLLGASGDNLSITTRQAQAYLEYVRDIQESIGDILIENVYKPFLEENNKVQLKDYRDITINFKLQAVEESSKAIGWIAAACNLGLISRDEGRNALGYKGKALDLKDIDVPNIQPEIKRDKKPQNPEDDPDKTKKNPDGDPARRSHE